MRRLMTWWQYLQKPALILGAVLGALSVTACMYFIERQWYIDFQPTIASSLAVAAAIWTISLTILHREEDRFERVRDEFSKVKYLWDRKQYDQLTETEPGSPLFKLPPAVAHEIWIASMFGGIRERQAFGIEFDHKQLDISHEKIGEWLIKCEQNERFLPFEPTGVRNQLLEKS